MKIFCCLVLVITACSFNPSGSLDGEVDAMGDGVVLTPDAQIDAPIDAPPPLVASIVGDCYVRPQAPPADGVTVGRPKTLVCLAEARQCTATNSRVPSAPLPMTPPVQPGVGEWEVSFTPVFTGVNEFTFTCEGDVGSVATAGPLALHAMSLQITEGVSVIDQSLGQYQLLNRNGRIRLVWGIPDDPTPQTCGNSVSGLPTVNIGSGGRPCVGEIYDLLVPTNGPAGTVVLRFSSALYGGSISVEVPAS